METIDDQGNARILLADDGDGQGCAAAGVSAGDGPSDPGVQATVTSSGPDPVDTQGSDLPPFDPKIMALPDFGAGGGGYLPPVKGNKINVECPGKYTSLVVQALVTTNPAFGAAQLLAKASGNVTSIGTDANLGGSWGKWGLNVHAGDSLAFDPKGNIAYIRSTGYGGGIGGEVGATIQYGQMVFSSVFQLESGFFNVGNVSGGEGMAASVSTDEEGNMTFGVGAGGGLMYTAYRDKVTVKIIACTKP